MAEERTHKGVVSKAGATQTLSNGGLKAFAEINTGGQFPLKVGATEMYEEPFFTLLKGLRTGDNVSVTVIKNDKGYLNIKDLVILEGPVAGTNAPSAPQPASQDMVQVSMQNSVIIHHLHEWAALFHEMDKKAGWDGVKSKLQDVFAFEKSIYAGNMNPFELDVVVKQPGIPEDTFAGQRDPDEQEEV